jgi:hypothetical protein
MLGQPIANTGFRLRAMNQPRDLNRRVEEDWGFRWMRHGIPLLPLRFQILVINRIAGDGKVWIEPCLLNQTHDFVQIIH